MSHFSVVVCTWNRSRLLEGCLDTLLHQLDAPDHEIVVVDNGSTDNTRELVESMAREHPRLRLMVEPRLGVNNARNRALRDTDGDVIAFVDDDVRVHSRWLNALDEAFAHSPEARAIGGPVSLRWPSMRPRHVSSTALRYLGSLDYGPRARQLSPSEPVRGMNLAVRRDAALEVGGFLESMGRRGTSLSTCGEDEFLLRLHRTGYQVWWAPTAAVTHVVDTRRLTVQWLIRRAWRQGTSEALVARHSKRSGVSSPYRSSLRGLGARLGRIESRRARAAEVGLLSLQTTAHVLARVRYS